MNIFQTLKKEHELFHRLIERLEADITHGVETIRKDIDRTLLIMQMALNQHEMIEDLIFKDPVYRSSKGAQKILNLVAAQHKEIRGLQGDIQKLQQLEKRYDLARLKNLVFTLCEKLRLHFFTEETKLWPHYNLTMKQPVGQDVHQEAQKNVKHLEMEIRIYAAAVEEYV